MDLKKIKRENTDWIRLTRDIVQWLDLVQKVMIRWIA
jgi:hypothetical protein